MKVSFNKADLTTIHTSLIGTKNLLEEAELIALENIKDNPNEYFQYSDYLYQINSTITKVERYLNECSN